LPTPVALEANDNPLRDDPVPGSVAQAKALLVQAQLLAERLRLQLEGVVLVVPCPYHVAQIPQRW
jgi:hypothetical protein